MMSVRPFHLAFPVRDLESTRRFYLEVLGCGAGRSGDDWLDIDFFGSQIVAHVMEGGEDCLPRVGVNEIDGHEVPLPHFGAVLAPTEWAKMIDRLYDAEVEWVIEPHTRYPGSLNEQSSMIFRDPSGNVVELKAFADLGQLFATD